MAGRGECGGGWSLVLTILTVDETGSTNADLLEMAREGAAEGIWLRAERQTGGRGRMGRAWHSPEGNLYASTLVRLRPDDPPAATLALAAGVALQAAVGAPATLKWPNDLIIDGAKCAGILLERADDAVVIGFGVNIASAPNGLDRAVTALASHGLDLTIESVAYSFERRLKDWRSGGVAAIATAWQSAAHPPGTRLAVRLGDGAELHGAFDRLAPDGGLRLRLDDLNIRTIHAGDVFLI